MCNVHGHGSHGRKKFDLKRTQGLSKMHILAAHTSKIFTSLRLNDRSGNILSGTTARL